MTKAAMFTCIRLETNDIRLAVIDRPGGEVLRRESLNPDFPILTHAGSIAEPERLAALLRQRFQSLDLPLNVKVAMGLKYLDLKLLSLPALPPGERDTVIRDEAARESIFSYSGEPVAVAYRIFSPAARSSTGLTVLTATTPREVIRSIVSLFDDAGLKLISVEPSFIGVQRYVAKQMPDAKPNPAVLAVFNNEAELYVFRENAPPLFWRHLGAGVDNPERLETDVATSLSHYNARAGAGTQVEILRQIGRELTSTLSVGSEIRRHSGELWPDLAGMGFHDAKEPVMAFFQAETSTSGDGPAFFTMIGAGLILLAIVVNGLLGWHLFNDYHRTNTLHKAVLAEKKAVATEKALLKSAAGPLNSVSSTFKADELMGLIRAAIPSGLRLEEIRMDPPAKKLEIAGICREPQALDGFLKKLKEIEGTLLLDSVVSQAKQSTTATVYSFRLNITLEGSGYE